MTQSICPVQAPMVDRRTMTTNVQTTVSSKTQPYSTQYYSVAPFHSTPKPYYIRPKNCPSKTSQRASDGQLNYFNTQRLLFFLILLLFVPPTQKKTQQCSSIRPLSATQDGPDKRAGNVAFLRRRPRFTVEPNPQRDWLPRVARNSHNGRTVIMKG